MSKYRIYHTKSGTWVSDIHVNYGDYVYDEAYIADIEFISEDEKEFAKVFEDIEYTRLSETLLGQHGLRRIYESQETYMFYSNELHAWLSSIISDSHRYGFTFDGEEKAPLMEFKADKGYAIKVTDLIKINWLKENTGLEAVRVDE